MVPWRLCGGYVVLVVLAVVVVVVMVAVVAVGCGGKVVLGGCGRGWGKERRGKELPALPCLPCLACAAAPCPACPVLPFTVLLCLAWSACPACFACLPSRRGQARRGEASRGGPPSTTVPNLIRLGRVFVCRVSFPHGVLHSRPLNISLHATHNAWGARGTWNACDA